MGLFRPQAVWPFPKDRLKELAKTHKRFVCVEMSSGQMVNDVQRHLNGEAVATHYGKRGGKIHTTADILGHVKTILKEGK